MHVLFGNDTKPANLSLTPIHSHVVSEGRKFSGFLLKYSVCPDGCLPILSLGLDKRSPRCGLLPGAMPAAAYRTWRFCIAPGCFVPVPELELTSAPVSWDLHRCGTPAPCLAISGYHCV